MSLPQADKQRFRNKRKTTTSTNAGSHRENATYLLINASAIHTVYLHQKKLILECQINVSSLVNLSIFFTASELYLDTPPPRLTTCINLKLRKCPVFTISSRYIAIRFRVYYVTSSKK